MDGKSKMRVKIDGIGLVLFERSKRAKHLNVSIQPFKGVRVAVPCGLTFQRAEKIFLSKKDWAQKHLARMKIVEQGINSRKANGIEIDRQVAKEILVNRLYELAVKYGFSYNRVFIRNQKTRWGSCSSRNNINLNIKLITLPEELMDYVIIHELVHTRHRNHGYDFWHELNRFLPEARKIHQQLKLYRPLEI